MESSKQIKLSQGKKTTKKNESTQISFFWLLMWVSCETARRAVAALAILFVIEGNSLEMSHSDLADMFHSSHAEKLAVNSRSKRSLDSHSFSYASDYNYHGRDYSSPSFFHSTINDFATTALAVSAKLLSSK